MMMTMTMMIIIMLMIIIMIMSWSWWLSNLGCLLFHVIHGQDMHWDHGLETHWGMAHLRTPVETLIIVDLTNCIVVKKNIPNF